MARPRQRYEDLSPSRVRRLKALLLAPSALVGALLFVLGRSLMCAVNARPKLAARKAREAGAFAAPRCRRDPGRIPDWAGLSSG